MLTACRRGLCDPYGLCLCGDVVEVLDAPAPDVDFEPEGELYLPRDPYREAGSAASLLLGAVIGAVVVLFALGRWDMVGTAASSVCSAVLQAIRYLTTG